MNKILVGILVILFLVVVLPVLGLWLILPPHTHYFFINRDRMNEEFSVNLTDDVKLVSYCDSSFLCSIDSELIVEVDDADHFLEKNIKGDLEKGDLTYGDDYKYSRDATGMIYVRIEPYEDKYHVHLHYID